MGKYTYVGGDYLENIGGNKIVHVVGDNDVHSNKQIIQKADGGIFYEEPKDAPEKKVEEDKQQPITPVTKMALISPSKDYKGEFGIDWCEKDDDFDKIVSFQNTKVTDIEYVFDEATKQFKKATATDDNLKQTLVKQMYLAKSYTDGAKKKEYLTTWMNIAEGITAKINLTTWFIDTAKKADSEKEFITFTPNENFEITYDKVLNENIKIKVKSHKKQYNLEIKAIKTFETDQIISIVDEAGNPVGQIEMMANNQETLEIKIIPVVLKTNEAEQNTKAADIYDKAIAAKNADSKNLNDTFNKVSLNQAGIKSTIVANPKGTEKLVIDVNIDFKKYYDKTGKYFKDWDLSDDEKDKTKNEILKPKVYEDEDGIKHFETYKTELTVKDGTTSQRETLIDTERFLLDELKEKYYSRYGKSFKGAIVFVTDIEYDTKKGAGAYSENIPIRNQGVIIFNNRLNNSPTYAHEIGHMLGLEHTFFKDEEEMKKTNKTIKDVFLGNINNNNDYYNKKIERKQKSSELRQNEIPEYELEIKNEEKLGKKKSANFINNRKELIEGNKKEIDKLKKEIIDIQKEQDIENLKQQEFIDVLSGLKFMIKKEGSRNFMDYVENQLLFNKPQSKKINDEKKKYY